MVQTKHTRSRAAVRTTPKKPTRRKTEAAPRKPAATKTAKAAKPLATKTKQAKKEMTEKYEVTTLDELIAALPKVQQQRVQEKADRLIKAEYARREERTLRELRKAKTFSQLDLAKLMGMTQGDVSKLERRSDSLLSTVRRYIESIGGQLDLVATFPDLGSFNLTTKPKKKSKKSQPKG